MTRAPALDSSTRQACLPALLGAWLAFACGGSERPSPLGSGRPIRGCEHFSYRPCDIMTPSCQNEIFDLVACMHGYTGAIDPPPVRQLDEASALALVAEDASGPMMDGLEAMADLPMTDRTSDERAFRTEVRGLELLGQLAPGLIGDPQDVLEQSVSRVIAYYRVSTREIVIIDRGDPIDDLQANAVLAHEFVHSLQDRRYDLTTFGFEQALDSDAMLARASLIEGEASLYQYLLGFAYRGADLERVDYADFFERLLRAGLDATIEAGSPALTANSIFPYTFGVVYAGRSWLEGGSRALDARFLAPPRTSWEVLGGGADASREPSRVEASPRPLDGYTLAAGDVAGAWVSVATLAGFAPDSQAARALVDLANQWQRDRYWIYATADEPGAVAALWAIDWASAEAAAQFSARAAGLAAPDGVLRIDTSGSHTRFVGVEREGDRERWRARLAELTTD